MLTDQERQSIQGKLLIRRPITLAEALKLWDYVEVLEYERQQVSASINKAEPTTPR
ncbi:MAG: hypothetical protein WCJ96_11470 [Verrucomicrobiota bacterium]